MRSSSRIAIGVLIFIGLVLYTMNGINPEIKKSKIYSDANELIMDYIKSVESINDTYYYENTDIEKKMKASLIKYSDTISERNRLLVSATFQDNYIDVLRIFPHEYNELYYVVFNGRMNKISDTLSIRKIEEKDYTYNIKNFLKSYNSSFDKIPKYERGENLQIYRGDVTVKSDVETNYVIYFAVVDEGEGLVIDGTTVIELAQN